MSDDDAPDAEIDDLVDMVWDLADQVPVHRRAETVDRAFELIEAHGAGAYQQLKELFEHACEEAALPPHGRRRHVPAVNPVSNFRERPRRRSRRAATDAHEAEPDAEQTSPSPAEVEPGPPEDPANPPLPEPPALPPPFAEQSTNPHFEHSESYFEKLARDVEVVSGDGADFGDPQGTHTLVTEKGKRRKSKRGRRKRRKADR